MPALKTQTKNILMAAFVLLLIGIVGEMDYQDAKRAAMVESVQDDWQVTADILNRLSNDYEESLANE